MWAVRVADATAPRHAGRLRSRRLPKPGRKRYILGMVRTVVDLTFEELAEAGAKASAAAREAAERAGVTVATLQNAEPPTTGPGRATSRSPRKASGMRRRAGG
jgi:hypothetical protein